MLVSVAKLAKVGRTEVDVPSPISLGAAVTRVAYLLSFNKSEAVTAMVWAANPYL